MYRLKRKYKALKFDKVRYLRRTKKRLKKRFNIAFRPKKLKHGVLRLKVIRRNTFINLSRRVKRKNRPKKSNRFEKRRKKRTYLKLLYAVSMGHLKKYRGRARSSPVARRELALL